MSGNVANIDGCVTVSGDVSLILSANKTLTVKGINVESGKSLTIYAQSTGENAGILKSENVAENQAGIGGGDGQAAGSIAIYGGKITVKGGKEAAGIGGGYSGSGADNGGSISITGGTISANGGSDAAGIGGGSSGKGTDRGSITISGGQVSANGAGGAAGIGNGINQGQRDNDITLSLSQNTDWLYATFYSPVVRIAPDKNLYIQGETTPIAVIDDRMVSDEALIQISGKILVKDPYTPPAPTPDPDPTPDPTPAPAQPGTTRPAVGQKQNVTDLFSQSYQKYVASPKGIVSISSKGVIIGKKAGKVTVTGYVKDGKKWVPGPEKVTLTIEKPTFKEKRMTGTRAGQWINAASNLTGVSVSPTRWTSSKSSVAEISNYGNIKTKKGGSTKITAYFGEGKQASKFSFTLQVKIPKLSKTKSTLKAGKSTRLSVKSTSLTPRWHSSNPSVATVDSTGRVTAKAPGNATITATIEGVAYSCQITVK